MVPGVDNVGAEVAQHVEDLSKRHGVVQWRDRSSQGWEVTRGFWRRHQIAHVAFARTEVSVNQARIEASCRQPFGQCDRLDRRSADIQSSDDAEDTCHRVSSQTL
jgi:hypothetical protein